MFASVCTDLRIVVTLLLRQNARSIFLTFVRAPEWGDRETQDDFCLVMHLLFSYHFVAYLWQTTSIL